MKRIIAYNLYNKNSDTKVHEILPQMLVIEPSAEYYSVNEQRDCRLYFPVFINEREIKEGYKYTYYKINGKLYGSIGTSKIDYWLKQKQGNVQLTLL